MDELQNRRRHIVVLDDDTDLRRELGQLLAHEDFDVTTIGDALHLDGLNLGRSDILILDMMLQDSDGADVLTWLAGLPHPPRLILMTGHGETVLRAAAAAAERSGLVVLGVLLKPFEPMDLVALVRSSADVTHFRPCSIYSNSAIRNAVDAALESGGLPVSFQPLVSSSTLDFVGAEALLAGWLPDLGEISPPAIVDALEGDVSLIMRLTLDVLRQSVDACRAWTDAGWSGQVSINLPVEALIQPRAVDQFAVIVERAGIPPSQVVFELTENALYDSSSAALTALLKLSLAGFGLALDDLGQRQSGLMQLANLPVTEFKIDMELVRAARSWNKGRDIFVTLADLGNRLGVAIVAEGVEKPEDLDLVRRNRVDYVQGFLVSRKVPLAELMAMLPRLTSSLSDYASRRDAG